MARGKEVLPAIASISYKYQCAAEMPWREIEGAAGKSFTPDERVEIHGCANAFDEEEQFFLKAPPLREVKKLRDELLLHCKALVRLAELHRPIGGHARQQPETDVVSALQIHYGTKDFYFRDAFHSVALNAATIAAGLKDELTFEAQTTSKSPETAGLEGFLRRVLDGAEATQARSTPPGSFVKVGFEYSRWGMSIGPRAAGFAKFASAVLGRDINPGMLRNAWPHPS